MNKCPVCSNDIQNGQEYCANCGTDLHQNPPQQTKENAAPGVVNSAAKLDWYYVMNGARMGPIPESELIRLYSVHQLSSNTKVWSAETPDWIELGLTRLVIEENNPPPLSGNDISNTYVWILAFVPIIGTIVESMISGATGIASSSLWIVSIMLNSVLCIVDQRKLKRAGYDTKELLLWAFILVPVYLFRRANLLKQKCTYPIVWCVTFAILLFAPSMFSGFTGISDSKIVASVKGGTFEEYPDKTLGEMVDGYFADPKWESIVADDGNTYVNISGKILYNDKEINVRLQYKYNPDSTFKYNAMEFNEIPQNALVYGALFQKMYDE